ncbi:MAG: RodZ domain-containing protein [Paracoccaceae bacterium]
MIGRKSSDKAEEIDVQPKGFDDFELRLGDVMRGERATMGKSLLDVQRELRIKAGYIAAIENCDPSAFDTPGFIAGYVRSYARYLDMDPDKAFSSFCEESGFSVAHGMSDKASVIKKQGREERLSIGRDRSDPLVSPTMPFIPAGDGFWSHIEPRAIGSMIVLAGLLGAIGLGGWTVLKEVQRVQFAPVEQTPVVLADLDPLNTTIAAASVPDTLSASVDQLTKPASAEAFDRLYRPQALDVPVMVSRDAPISTLDPSALGSFAAPVAVQAPVALASDTAPSLVPQVLEEIAPSLQVVAVRPSWVRVRAADGTVIYETIMESGETYEVPMTEEPPTLRVGESGAVYFAMNGKHYGPAGPTGRVTSNLALSIDAISETLSVADLSQDQDLAQMVAELQAPAEAALPVQD